MGGRYPSPKRLHTVFRIQFRHYKLVRIWIQFRSRDSMTINCEIIELKKSSSMKGRRSYRKSPQKKREHLAIQQNIKFLHLFFFCGSVFPSWIRIHPIQHKCESMRIWIRIRNTVFPNPSLLTAWH
jgi:hypothetical protein